MHAKGLELMFVVIGAQDNILLPVGTDDQGTEVVLDGV